VALRYAENRHDLSILGQLETLFFSFECLYNIFNAYAVLKPGGPRRMLKINLEFLEKEFLHSGKIFDCGFQDWDYYGGGGITPKESLVRGPIFPKGPAPELRNMIIKVLKNSLKN
jgi:hypothetical protein